MDDATEVKVATEPKSKGPSVTKPRSTGNKFEDARMAIKKRKRDAHRRTIRSSNANG